MTVPSPPPPPPPADYARDARHKARQANNRAYEPLNDPKKACWHACLGPLSHMLCVPLFLAGVFDFEELHMLNRDHLNY